MASAEPVNSGYASWDDEFSDVLSLLVEIWPDASRDCKTLCSLLQLNTGCRRALQLSRGHCCVTLRATDMAGFAAWLPGHAALVKELQVDRPWGWYCLKQGDRDAIFDGMSRKLAAALQEASARAAAAPSSVPPQLVTFRSNSLFSQSVISALPCARLAALQLDMSDMCKGWDARAFGAAVQHLTNLRSMDLVCSVTPLLDDSTQGWSALSSLTSLKVSHVGAAAIGNLPASLRRLEAAVYIRITPDTRDADATQLLDINCSHLMQLQQLDLQAYVYNSRRCEAGGAVWDNVTVTVPPSVTELSLKGPLQDVLGVLRRQQLQQCILQGCRCSPGRLAQLLHGMPSLVQLRVLGGAVDHRGGDALVQMSVTEGQVVAAALASATKLTSLHLEGYSVVAPAPVAEAQADAAVGDDSGAGESGDGDGAAGDVAEPECVLWGRHLACLRQLRSLVLPFEFNQCADALCITELTGLTKLWLEGCGAAVTDDVVVCLCSSLSDLCDLLITGSGATSGVAVLGAAAGLSGLSRLCLPLNAGMALDDADLALLHGCNGLKRLSLPKCEGVMCSDTSLRQLREQLPGLYVSIDDTMCERSTW